MKVNAYNQIRIHIAENDIQQAIGVFITQLKGDSHLDTLLAIASRYKTLVENRLKDTISSEAYTVDHSRITNDLLELINLVDTSQVINWMATLQTPSEEKLLAKELVQILDKTYSGFQAQARIRNLLYQQMVQRLGIEERLEYEVFFSTYYEQMNPEELRKHVTIRSYTENILSIYNQKALELIQSNADLIEALPRLKVLETHLVIWMAKFMGVFQGTPSMSLVYVGVEEKVPFPSGIESELRTFYSE